MIALLFALTLAGATGLTEAERCAQLLEHAGEKSFAARRAVIADNDHYVEIALARMKKTGDLRDDARESNLRGQLKLGAIFAREGLVHEAIYQTFVARFPKWRDAREAIRNFKHLSHARDRGVLIAEVIERTLQYVPDVHVGNVAELTARAVFLNLDPAQLREFRDRWIVYDADDRFAELLQGAIDSILTAADPKVVADVGARGSLVRRLLGRAEGLALPPRPTPLDDRVTPRSIAMENAPYYDGRDLLDYLERSSAAARQYFLMSSLAFVNLDQLEHILSRPWDIKASLRAALEAERDRRAPWVARALELDELRALERELTQELVMVERQRRFDNAAAQAAIGRLWRATDPVEAARLAAELLERVGEEATPAQFTGTVVSVRDATLSRLAGHAGSRRLLDIVVTHGVALGLDDAQFGKIAGVLNDWAERLPAAQRAAARRETARLAPRRRTLPRLNPPALHRRRDDTRELIRAGEAERDRVWAAVAGGE